MILRKVSKTVFKTFLAQLGPILGGGRGGGMQYPYPTVGPQEKG